MCLDYFNSKDNVYDYTLTKQTITSNYNGKCYKKYYKKEKK